MPPRIAPCVVALAVAGAFFLGACGVSSHTARARAMKPEGERKAAPDFSLKDSEGRTVRLSDYRGKVVLLNFWATWCGPCKVEIPWFMEFEQQHKDQGFAVLGIAMDDEGWDAVKPYITERRVNYRILMGNGPLAEQWGGVESIPTTFMIDRQGKIARTHVGLASRDEYQDDIVQLLDRAAAVGGAR